MIRDSFESLFFFEAKSLACKGDFARKGKRVSVCIENVSTKFPIYFLVHKLANMEYYIR